MAYILQSVRTLLGASLPVFIDKQPPEPTECLTIYATGGAGPHNCFADTQAGKTAGEHCSIQLRSRAADSPTAEANITAAAKKLHMYSGADSSYTIKAIRQTGGILGIGRDENENPAYTVNFDIDYQTK